MNIPMANPFVGEDEAKAVYDIIKSGRLSMGPKVSEFEKEFATMVGSKYAISTNNGTAALHVALIAAGIKDGDEVLIPNITFASTAKVVMYERATPILVECDPLTYNISVSDAEKKITSKTKAIIPVDMNGMPVDYDAILDLASRYNLKVIADSAESVGAVYKNKKIGSIAPLHIFSFFPNKNITTGEGGMVTTNDRLLANKISQLRNMGQDYRYHHKYLGFNYRMTDISAVIGLSQLKKMEYVKSERRRIVDYYNHGLSGCRGIDIPHVPKYVDEHAWYMYTVSLDKNVDRSLIQEGLKEVGIDTRNSFPPIHTQPFYTEHFGFHEDEYPVSLSSWKSLLNLPIWVGLKESQQSFIMKKLADLVNDNL